MSGLFVVGGARVPLACLLWARCLESSCSPLFLLSFLAVFSSFLFHLALSAFVKLVRLGSGLPVLSSVAAVSSLSVSCFSSVF